MFPLNRQSTKVLANNYMAIKSCQRRFVCKQKCYCLRQLANSPREHQECFRFCIAKFRNAILPELVRETRDYTVLSNAKTNNNKTETSLFVCCRWPVDSPGHSAISRSLPIPKLRILTAPKPHTPETLSRQSAHKAPRNR